MSHIYDFFDNHMEAWGAVLFVVAACVAVAAALNGAL